MNPFDEQFTRQVKDVFAAYHEDVDEAAWAQLKGRLGTGKKAFVYFLPLLWSAAALLLLATGLFLWQATTQQGTTPDVAGTETAQPAPPEILTIIPESADEESTKPAPADKVEEEIRMKPEPSLQKPSPGREAITIASIEKQGPTPREHEDGLPVETDKSDHASRPIAALLIQGDSPPLKSPVRSVETDIRVPILPTRATGGNVDIVMGSVITITDSQIADGIGFAAGAMRHWRLTKGISISTGGMLTYNSFEFRPSGATNRQMAVAEQSAASVPFIENINTRRSLDFLAIDVPLNMNFHLSENRAGTFRMSVGLSSLIYLQQNYRDETQSFIGRNEFNVDTGAEEFVLRTSMSESSGSTTGPTRYDWARILNMSVGYSLPGRNRNLALEIYLKYPLGTLTEREISMAMSGVTLRYGMGR